MHGHNPEPCFPVFQRRRRALLVAYPLIIYLRHPFLPNLSVCHSGMPLAQGGHVLQGNCAAALSSEGTELMICLNEIWQSHSLWYWLDTGV